MKRLLLSLSVIAAGFCFANAQSSFVPGVIITQQHDSLKGLIKLKNWSTNPGEIEFKTDNATDSRKYTASEVNGFVILQKNLVYLSRHFTADITYYETTTLKEEAMKMEMMDSTLFLQQLVTGDYVLFYYRDVHSRDHYLYQVKDGPVTELRYVKTIVPTESGAQMYERKIYEDQLDTLFHDDPNLVKQNKFLKYYESPLVKAFVSYNNFKNPTQTTELKRVKRNPVWFGFIGGISFNSYKFKGDHYLNTRYSSSVNPAVGVFIDIPLQAANRNFSLYNEILYKTVNTSGTLSDFFMRGQEAS